jgi:NADPH:quinone reductase-like Zn-dependent oxidoreductase
MKGLGFAEHGGPDRVGIVEVPDPRPGPGEIRLRVEAASFNRLDRWTVEGLPGVPIERPHILGSDATGVVDELGPDVTGPAVGTPVVLNPGLFDGTCEWCRAGQEALCRSLRIVGEHTQGTMAPYIVVPAGNVYPRPSRLSLAEAAAAPLVFQTAWRALLTVGALSKGETVAVVGAGGGVAPAAVQVAKLFGARVIVIARSPEKAARARELGADDVLVISEQNPLDKALWEWSGKRGVDLVFDSVGAATVPRSLRALARGGRVVVIGATTGPKVEVDLRTLFWRQLSLRGSTMSTRLEFEAMLTRLDRGELRPVVDAEFPFAHAVEAFRRLGDPDVFGKVVVRIDGGAG